VTEQLGLAKRTALDAPAAARATAGHDPGAAAEEQEREIVAGAQAGTARVRPS
jgi:hypothetical protein